MASIKPADDRHSLQQLRLIERLIRTPLDDRKALFVAGQFVVHGLPRAGELIEKVSASIDNRAVRSHLASLAKADAVLRALPFRERALNDVALMDQLYACDGYVPFEVAGSAKLIVVFTTMYNNFGISNALLLAQLMEFDASVLFVKDCTLFNYLNGVRGLGETIAGVAESIEMIARKMGAEQLYFTGFSSGSYAALQAALLTGAKGYLGFSAITDLSDGSALLPPKFFTPDVRAAIDPACLQNLREPIERNGARLAGKIYYGRRSITDAQHADNLRGLPGFDIVELPNSGHNVILNLVEQGRLGQCFSDLLDL